MRNSTSAAGSRAIASAALLLALLAACTSPEPTAGVSTAAPPSIATAAVDQAAIATVIDSLNQSAGSVSAQQDLLRSTVHPDFTAEQQACAAATVTVRLDVAFDELQADPSWRPAGDTAPPRGTVYRLPALLEVYTNGLRTGTDLTLLRLAVLDGQVRIFPLCLV